MLNFIAPGGKCQATPFPPPLVKIQQPRSRVFVISDLKRHPGMDDGLFFFQGSGIVHADGGIRDFHIRQDLC